MKETKFQILGYTLSASFAIGLILLAAYVYVILYNYLYKKYRNKLNENNEIFDVSSPKETFISMLDVILIGMLFSIKVVTLKDKK